MVWHTLQDTRRANSRCVRFYAPDGEVPKTEKIFSPPLCAGAQLQLEDVERDYNPFTAIDEAEVLEVENCGPRDPDQGDIFHGHFEDDKYVQIPPGILS